MLQVPNLACVISDTWSYLTPILEALLLLIQKLQFYPGKCEPAFNKTGPNHVPAMLETWNLECSFLMVNLAQIPIFISLLLIVFGLEGLIKNLTTCNKTVPINVTGLKLDA